MAEIVTIVILVVVAVLVLWAALVTLWIAFVWLITKLHRGKEFAEKHYPPEELARLRELGL